MKRKLGEFLDKIKSLDFFLIIIVLALAVYGLFAVYSATQYMNSVKPFLTHLGAAVAGVFAMLFVSMNNYESVAKRFSTLIFIAAVLMLAGTLVLGIGTGNKSWIKIPVLNVNFQSSEFVKMLFIMTFGYHLSRVKNNINSFKNIIALCIHAGLIIGLVLIQGDLGTALVFVMIFLTMCFVAGVSYWYYAACFFVVGVASPYIWSFLEEYQQMRILVGFNPELDPEKYGYQVIQGKKAVSNGGIWGQGYMKGTLTQGSRNALPEKYSDMIFTTVCEELGFVGAILYFVLIIALVIRIIYIARKTECEMGSYMCVGVAAMIIFQTIENVGMCLGLLPVIGITLPFMSYGGSSVVSMLLCMGLVLSIESNKTKYLTMEFEKKSSKRRGGC